MTPYTFEEIQFLNKPTQEENMFTPKFEKLRKLQKTSQDRFRNFGQMLSKTTQSQLKHFFKITKSKTNNQQRRLHWHVRKKKCQLWI
jgi:mRNA-degrading endonuclease RelE of RelBE toxin-antitoxin system